MNENPESTAPVSKDDMTMSYVSLHSQFNFMLGDILTILDATVVDKQQNKAVKDLVKRTVWDRFNFMTPSSRGAVGGIDTVPIE